MDVVSDAAAPAIVGPPGIDMPSDGRMNIQDDGVVPGVRTEDSIVSLETNDAFAIGIGLMVRWTAFSQLVRSLTDIQALDNESQA